MGIVNLTFGKWVLYHLIKPIAPPLSHSPTFTFSYTSTLGLPYGIQQEESGSEIQPKVETLHGVHMISRKL